MHDIATYIHNSYTVQHFRGQAKLMKKHDTRQKVDYKALSQLIYNLYRNLVTQFCTSVSYLLDVYYEHKDKKEFGKIRQSKNIYGLVATYKNGHKNVQRFT